MNIEKLAKRLKEFTLDEIEMIAECDCKTELEHLLNNNKILFDKEIYKYIEERKNIDYTIITANIFNNQSLDFGSAVKYFLENYAKQNCTKRTYETYKSIFRVNILPFFRGKIIQDITIEDIEEFYKTCKTRNLGVRRLKNTLTQLNQLLKYCRNLGLASNCCYFQVRRLTDKNKFSLDRIIFEE